MSLPPVFCLVYGMNSHPLQKPQKTGDPFSRLCQRDQKSGQAGLLHRRRLRSCRQTCSNRIQKLFVIDWLLEIGGCASLERAFFAP